MVLIEINGVFVNFFVDFIKGESSIYWISLTSNAHFCQKTDLTSECVLLT